MNKKFTCLFALSLLAVFVFTANAFALNNSSPFHVSKWSSYQNQNIKARYSDYVYAYSLPNFGQNCFYFARLVTNKTSGADFYRQTSDMRAIDTNSITGKYTLIAQHFGSVTQQQVKDAFSKASPGDVVQYKRYSSYSRAIKQHTLIIASVNSYGFETLEANFTYGKITNGSRSFSTFTSENNAAGSSGGFSIYHFGSGNNNNNVVTVKPTINSVPNGSIAVAGEYFSEKCTAEGSNITWKISSGAYPKNLSMNSSTGEFSGTVNSSIGKDTRMPVQYNFKVKASNSAGSDTKSGWIRVYAPHVINTSSLPNGKVGSYYSQTISAQGTEYSMRWTLKSGSLPPGLKFNASNNKRTATISGTPTRAGNYTFTVQLYNLVGNANTTTTKKFTMTINYGGYISRVRDTSITTSGTFASGIVDRSYSRYISVNNVTREKFSVTSTFTKPDGLEFVTSGRLIYLKGIPTKAGNYRFSIRITREDGHFNEVGPFNMSVYSRNSSTYAVKVSEAEELDEFSSENALTPLYLVSDKNKNLEGSVTVEACQPLEFKIGEWIDESGFYVEEISDFEILIDDEVSEHVTILDNNSFLIESEAVTGEFTVCARALAGDIEIRTNEINIVTDTTQTGSDISNVIAADSDSKNTEESSSTGGCNITLGGTMLLALCGTMIFRKK